MTLHILTFINGFFLSSESKILLQNNLLMKITWNFPSMLPKWWEFLDVVKKNLQEITYNQSYVAVYIVKSGDELAYNTHSLVIKWLW